MATRPTNKAKATAANTLSGIQNLIDSAQELLETLRDEQGPAVERLREKVSKTIDSAHKRLNELDVPELASDAIDNTMGFVRGDPWRAVAIGAFALLALSLLSRD